MTDTQFISSEIHRTVHDIVDGLTSELKRAVDDKVILDTEGLDQYLWESVDGCEWVIYTYKAKLIATEADWDECKAEYGAEAITPERLAFFHLIEEARGSDEYQELWEKLEHGDEGDAL